MKSFVILFLSLTATLQTSLATSSKTTFVYCSEGSPSSFNAQLADDNTTFNAVKEVYEHLVQFKIGTTQVTPGLAESWKISADGKNYTFKLRKGVNFHTTAYFKPTRTMNADDVLFSFDRMRVKSHPYHRIGGGTYEYFHAMEFDTLIKDIKKIDDSTVEFQLTRPEAPFLADLAMDFTPIHSKEYADYLLSQKKPEKIDFEPVGTGPFQFVRYDKDQMIRYKRNDNYWGKKPVFEQVLFTITPDASVRTQKLRVNECQLVAEPSFADLPELKKSTDMKVMQASGLTISYLALNVEKKPLNLTKVRQAIAIALNRKSYLNSVFLGNAVLAKNPLPPAIWSYDYSTPEIPYDPEKARTLLKEAGYPNGFEIDLWTMPVSRPYLPNGKKLGELMQADLAKVGIRVKLVTYDWPTYLSKTKAGAHSMAHFGWLGDNGDPDNFLHTLLACAGVSVGANLSRWCNASYDKVVSEAKAFTSQKARIEAYRKAQKIFREEMPWVPIAHATFSRAMRKNVKGYVLDPLGGDWFRNVTLE